MVGLMNGSSVVMLVWCFFSVVCVVLLVCLVDRFGSVRLLVGLFGMGSMVEFLFE